MPKKVILKTKPNTASVSDFIKNISEDRLRQDCKTLLSLFKKATGKPAKLWGSSIIGFGSYTYHRSNGDEGKFMATGFSPRQSGPTIYIMPGYQDYNSLLKKLGPHKLGKSCLYLKNLEGINLIILEKLIKQGLSDLKKNHQTDY